MRLPKLEPETQFLLVAAAVGAAGALGNRVFREAIGLSADLFREAQGLVEPAHPFFGRLALVLVPVLGGLAIGILSRLVRRDIGGYAMPSFLETVNLKDARLSVRETLLRTLSAAITLGSGGSAGVEGPVASLGGGIGATIARTRHLVGERLQMMVACGSSAAIAAAYGAPIAGVFFAQEIVLAGNYDLQNFVRVVVASGTATVVARAMSGDEPLFEVEAFQIESGWEIASYLLLGLTCGVLAAAFSKVFYRAEGFFAGMSFPKILKPAFGGLVVGLIALAYPQVLGDGAEFMQELLHKPEYESMVGDVLVLFVLLAAKVLATSATLGSGGGGGVFGPSLFLGATLGAATGALAQHFLPEATGLPGHYAIVGMGAFLGGATRAPLTAIFLVFEMTGSSSTAVLPTLVAVAAAIYVARRFEPNSIDEMGLALRGIHLKAGREERTLTSVKVGRAMRRDFDTVPADTPAPRLQALITGSRSTSFVVVDGKDHMVGILTLQDLRTLDERTAEELGPLAIAADFAERDVVTVFPDETLADALRRMDRRGYRQLPVVTRDDPHRVIGLIERRHVIAAYQRALPGSEGPGG